MPSKRFICIIKIELMADFLLLKTALGINALFFNCAATRLWNFFGKFFFTLIFVGFFSNFEKMLSNMFYWTYWRHKCLDEKLTERHYQITGFSDISNGPQIPVFYCVQRYYGT